MREDKELEQYRRLMLPPSTFEDGFSIRSVIGCVFIGMVMMPASMYLSLSVGLGVGGAAQWVTTILFVELARRSFTTLKRPEIFILFYMAGVAASSPFAGLLWTQYYVQSDPARAAGIAEHIPAWIAPSAEAMSGGRTFLTRAWLGPILMIVLGNVLGRIDSFGLGYVLFRVTSDVEKLPFPMAPVSAMGVTALAESSAEVRGAEGGGGAGANWRWRVFSIGGMIGLLFGMLYVAIPAITGTFLKAPIELIPVTFVDLTTRTETFLPATPVTLSLNLGDFFVGMVLPFYAIVGSFLGMVITWIVNPILFSTGQLPNWTRGMSATETAYATQIDVYLSVGIGLSAAIAIIGFYHVFSGLRRRKERVVVEPTPSANSEFRIQNSELPPPAPTPPDSAWQRLMHPPAGRGDIPLWVGLAIYVFSTLFYVFLCHWLIPSFPTWILVLYGFVYTPLISYVAARMEGIAGQWVEIPMVREATFILAHKYGGYNGVDIWFAPIPLHNYAGQVVQFRSQELTGTKFTSLIKAELVLIPVGIIFGLVFVEYIWRMAPIPSAAYPQANRMWELNAKINALLHSSTLGGNSIFFEALKWPYVAGASVVGIGAYTALSAGGAPVMLCYGLVRGLGAGITAGMFPQLLGACVGRYVFEKRFGLKWREYAPVLFAGFSCGMGLVSMLAFGFVLISKAVFQLPY